MTKVIYFMAGLVGVIALISGLSGKRILLLQDTRSVIITLTVVGFIMCSTGALTPFVTKGPAHILSISGYLLGILALVVGLAQIFRWNLPFVSEPQKALIIIVIIIMLKVVIARFGFIFEKG